MFRKRLYISKNFDYLNYILKKLITLFNNVFLAIIITEIFSEMSDFNQNCIVISAFDKPSFKTQCSPTHLLMHDFTAAPKQMWSQCWGKIN